MGDLEGLKATYRSGPLVELLGLTLKEAGGPHFAVRCNASNAGTNGSVSKTAAAGSTGPAAAAVTVTGTPFDNYDVRILIVNPGLLGVATFRISFDGGDNYSDEYLTAASIATWAAETGLTILFAADDGGGPPVIYTYFAGDIYALTSTGPTYSSGDLAAAFNALQASPFDFEGVWVAGTVNGSDDATKVTNWVALATAVQGKMASWEGDFRFAFAALQVPNVADAALAVPSVQNLAADRLVAVLGDVEMISAATERQIRRSALLVVAARVAAIDFQRSPGAVEDGTLPAVVSLYRDERVTPGGDQLRFTTLRTFDSALAGYYVSEGKTFAAAGSDFGTIERRRTIDRLCKMGRRFMLPYIQKELDTNEDGTIDEKEAVAIEAIVNGQLSQDLVATKRLSNAEIQINRTDNLATSETLRAKVRGRRKPKSKWVELEIGFANPNLQGA